MLMKHSFTGGEGERRARVSGFETDLTSPWWVSLIRNNLAASIIHLHTYNCFVSSLWYFRTDKQHNNDETGEKHILLYPNAINRNKTKEKKTNLKERITKNLQLDNDGTVRTRTQLEFQ